MKLRNPNEFKTFKMDFNAKVKFDSTSPKYNLEQVYRTMKANVIPKGFISQLLDVEVLNSFNNTQEVLKRCILFDKINKSAAIAIKEDEKIKAIVNSFKATSHREDTPKSTNTGNLFPVKWVFFVT